MNIFRTADTTDTRGWPERVERAINKGMQNPVVTAKYLRDKYNLVLRGLKQGAGVREIGFLELYLEVLMGFAGMTHDDLSDRPVVKKPPADAWPVYYTPRPFRLVDFWRVPDDGVLTVTGSHRVYKSPDLEFQLNDVVGCDIYRMPGDDSARWLDVAYRITTSDATHHAYFAVIQSSPDGTTLFLDPTPLMSALLIGIRLATA